MLAHGKHSANIRVGVRVCYHSAVTVVELVLKIILIIHDT